MAYPSIQQYQEALQHPRTALTDAVLAKGTIRKSGLGTPIVVSGGFALTYAVEAGGTTYAVRCFHRESKGLERRYAAISTKLKSIRSPYFVNFEFQRHGVKVNGARYPIVKMAWASGKSLGVFVEDNHRDSGRLANLIRSLQELSAFLGQQGIAHGDIQEGNLIVSGDGNQIQLIDYDGMYVPEIASLGGSENGHRDYQHPKRLQTQYDDRLDRFSFIALDLALRALREQPELWRSSKSGAGVILFRANDFADPDGSQVISDISKTQNLRRQARDFISICSGTFGEVPTLLDFIAGKNIPKPAVRTRPSQTQEAARYISQYPVIDAVDFAAFQANQGQMVELIGRVVQVKVGKTRHGKPFVFINFADWRSKAVKITLWSEALGDVDEYPSDAWTGRWVTIKGLVEPVFKKSGYESISITAGALSQISDLADSEALYRLGKGPGRRKATTTSNLSNSRTLGQLRGGTQPPKGPATPTAPAPGPSNKQILDIMRGKPRPSQSAGLGSPGAPSGRPPSPSRPRPRPSSAPQTKSTGFWGWVFSIFD